LKGLRGALERGLEMAHRSRILRDLGSEAAVTARSCQRIRVATSADDASLARQKRLDCQGRADASPSVFASEARFSQLPGRPTRCIRFWRMKRANIPLAFPCGADFSAMPEVDRGRLCAACETVVHDLSSMSEAEARAVLAQRETARLCVRYLYDVDGRVVFAGRELAGARIIPDYALTRKAKVRLARAAMLAAPLVLFQACGGASAGFSGGYQTDGGDEENAGHRLADPDVSDAGADARDGGTADGGDATEREDASGGDGGDASDAAARDATDQ